MLYAFIGGLLVGCSIGVMVTCVIVYDRFDD